MKVEDEENLIEYLIGLESDIVKELAAVQKYKKKGEGGYYSIQEEQELRFNKDINYFEHFWKALIVNQLMVSQIKDISSTNHEFNDKINKLQKKIDEYFDHANSKSKKKNRRVDAEIKKQFSCPYDKCFKAYGSEVSLNLHIKNKHNGALGVAIFNIQKQYLRALKDRLPLPQISIKFPPGYLQQLAKEINLENIHKK